MELRLDLHVHSKSSLDGRMPLGEIIRLARAAGLDGAAICDHDRILPEAEARAALREAAQSGQEARTAARSGPEAETPDFLLIPGVEISTEYGHLLGWFVSRPIETHVFADAIRAIHAQGGIAVLAHPFARTADAERIAPLASLIDGVEVWNSRAERKNRRANAMAEAFAAAHGLRRFGGSDAHVPREIGNAATSIEADAPTLEAVKEALLHRAADVSGRRSRAADTAASQWTRRTKTGAGTLSYCKWALFAVKCWIEDWITGV